MTVTRDQLERLAQTDVRVSTPPDSLLPAPSSPSASSISIRAIRGSEIRLGLIHRCGTLEVASEDPQALSWLSANAQRIFDILSAKEREIAPNPVIGGVENTWLNSSGVDLPPVVDEFVEGSGEAGLRKEYLKVL